MGKQVSNSKLLLAILSTVRAWAKVHDARSNCVSGRDKTSPAWADAYIMHRERYDPKAKARRRGRRGLSIICLFLLVLVILTATRRTIAPPALLNPLASTQIPTKNQQSPRGSRIALIIPFMGSNFPPYFPIFSWSAAGSSSLVDFLIFHTGALPSSVTLSAPDNVKFIDLKDAEVR